MILDWSEVTAVAESPVWVWPVWAGDDEGPGLVRWVQLRGHAYLAVLATLHAGLVGAAVQHLFTEFVQLLGTTVTAPSTAGHVLQAPQATGHTLAVPSVTGHTFLPLE